MGRSWSLSTGSNRPNIVIQHCSLTSLPYWFAQQTSRECHLNGMLFSKMAFRSAVRNTGHSWQVVASVSRTCTGRSRIVGQSIRWFPLLLRVCRCAWVHQRTLRACYLLASYICFAEPKHACLTLHHNSDGGDNDLSYNCIVYRLCRY
jgi:hypothetical protein